MKVALPAIHDTGTGPPVVFFHAFPLDASQWDHQVAALSDRFRCLRPDFWGCGDSPPPPPDGSALGDFVEATLQALDEREVDSFVAVGLSLGGYLIMEFLRQAPERVRGAVLADTRSTADAEGPRNDRLEMADRVLREGVDGIVEPTVERLLAAQSRAQAHVSDPVRGRVRRCRPEGVAAAQRAMAARPDSGQLLGSLTIPVLVVGGSQDRASPPDVMASMATSIPGSRHEVIDGVGHLSNLEDPPAFTAILERFLLEVTDERTAPSAS
ncbi:MAG TPA: alpha/beta fold hydrolase [Candidatus Sulfotelmatobacter sp.]|nr:alpha/beta fold hydrolase [Candidatus Sulfotelmatobacter sp.]